MAHLKKNKRLHVLYSFDAKLVRQTPHNNSSQRIIKRIFISVMSAVKVNKWFATGSYIQVFALTKRRRDDRKLCQGGW